MQTPLRFTLLYQDLANKIFGGGDAGLDSITGELWFTPVFDNGARIPHVDGVGLCPREFRGRLDADGTLRAEGAESAGLRLWANDPDFGVDRFAYLVTAPKGLRARGLPVPWRPFEFDAPGIDEVRYLRAYMPRPGQKFGRGAAAYPLAGGTINVTDREVTFQNADGSLLTPIAIPDGYTVMVNNFDGTWSVG